jgi:hypothetical protein
MFEVFRKSPVKKSAFKPVKMHDVLGKFNQMNLCSGDLSRSIKFLTDLNLTWEMDLLERKHIKIKSDDSHLENLLRILNSELPENDAPMVTPILDQAFVASTEKKPSEHSQSIAMELRGISDKPQFIHSSSQCKANHEISICLEKTEKETSEDDHFIGGRRLHPNLFRDSTPGNEASSNDAKRLASQLEIAAMNKATLMETALKSLSNLKKELRDTSGKRKSSQARRSPGKEDSVLCCICHSSLA